MRFSFWPVAQQSWGTVLELARRAESTGWDGVWFADHFMPNADDNSAPVHEVWSVIAALCALVPRVRIGPLVLGNTYRHPAVVAKMAATADHISGGRVVLGVGAGWQENEHEAYGIEFSTVGGRLRRFEEACHIMRSLFDNERTDFDGKYYQIKDAPLAPKPIQSPLPIMIGGGGEKVTLRIVAQYADEWNVWGDVERLKQKMAILDQHCATVGRDPAAIERSAAALVYLSDDDALVRRLNSEPQARPTIAGNVNQLQDIVGEYRQAGVQELIVPDFHLPQGATAEKLEFMDRFISEVAPSAR